MAEGSEDETRQTRRDVVVGGVGLIAGIAAAVGYDTWSTGRKMYVQAVTPGEVRGVSQVEIPSATWGGGLYGQRPETIDATVVVESDAVTRLVWEEPNGETADSTQVGSGARRYSLTVPVVAGEHILRVEFADAKIEQAAIDLGVKGVVPF